MSLLAFPNLQESLAETVRSALIDYESLGTLLRSCDLKKCRGMCCHDGVFLGAEEKGGLAAEFGEENFEVSGKRWRTKRRRAKDSELAVNFPSHFPRTRCYFLDEKDFCKLQVAAVEQRHEPWYWKPVPCWLHPLSFHQDRETGRPVLVLPQEGKDPQGKSGYPGFASCTTCGLADCDPQAKPAYEVLADELNFLGQIGSREILEEVRTYFAEPSQTYL